MTTHASHPHEDGHAHGQRTGAGRPGWALTGLAANLAVDRALGHRRVRDVSSSNVSAARLHVFGDCPDPASRP